MTAARARRRQPLNHVRDRDEVLLDTGCGPALRRDERLEFDVRLLDRPRERDGGAIRRARRPGHLVGRSHRT